jgi:plasmid maintenance system antidote protein VapI
MPEQSEFTELVTELRRLYTHAGSPSYREVVRNAAVGGRDTLGNLLRGKHTPRWGFVEALVCYLGGDPEHFYELWTAEVPPEMSRLEKQRRYRVAWNWVTCPGETLAEWFVEMNLPLGIAWNVHCIPEDVLMRLLRGEEPLTAELASELQLMTHVAARFWLALEHNYRAGVANGLDHDHHDAFTREGQAGDAAG